MESESESIDIASLKLRALAPWQKAASEQGSRQNILHETLSQPASGIYDHDHNHALANTIETSALPSTVPESANINAALEALPQETLRQIAHKMSSENDATQELSPSELQLLIISKSKSVLVRDEETQHTLNEGDEGHIDLTSSFVQPQGNDSDDGGDGEGEVEESQPIEFSPTQTQNRLPEFPESQRFKTPATAGRKRKYSGGTRETPDLPRPNLRNGEPTPTHVLGLSQAFAATQAATSPFINGIANPLSDRPSPNVDLQVRPATATTSSPMRPLPELPLSDFKRATTEPASRYVPIAQSQAERNRRALLNLLDDESDDDFSQEPSHIRDERLQRERNAKLMEHFKVLSSPSKRPIRPNLAIKSSPIPPPQRSSSPAVNTRDAIQRSSPPENSRHGDVDVSEAETEQEDDPAQVQHSQHLVIDDEDKENDERVVQIPRTTARLQSVMDNLPSQVEQSPSLRHGDNRHDSSAPVAVANSQPSQPYPRSQRQQPKSSSTGGVDFVPQSPADPPAGSAGQPVKTAQEENQQFDDEEDEEGKHSSAPAHLGGTIPETSSSRQTGQMGPPVADHPTFSASMSNSNFETAPSRPAAATNSQSKILEMSSPPIVTTPPGRKRKRMTDIAADPSPQQSTQGFDPVEALQIDSEMVNLLSQSPIQTRNKRRQTRPPIRKIVETHNPALSEEPGPATPNEQEYLIPEAAERPVEEPVLTSHQSPTTQHSVLRRPTRRTTTQKRASVWDLEVSPQKSTPAPEDDFDSTPQRRSFRKLDQLINDTLRETPDERLPDSTKRRSPKSRRNPDAISARRKTPGKAQALVENFQGTGFSAIVQPSDNPVAPKSHGDTTPSEISKSTPTDEVVAPDMVFACFNGKIRAYYPARCLECIESDPVRYRVQWDGCDSGEVDAYGVKALDIRIGDLVKITMDGFAKVPYVVRGFKDKVTGAKLVGQTTDIRGFKTVLVAPKQRKSLPAEISTDTIQEAPIALIYLDNNMWRPMKQRSFEFRPQVRKTMVSSGYATPLETSSTPSTPSSRTKRQPFNTASAMMQQNDGIFSNMIFAVSYDDSTRKDFIVDSVRAHGGTIMREAFTELLQPDSTEPKTHYANVGFTALLADKLSRKEKYMQALALGLPCLSGKWIEACIKSKEIVDWHTYLLPAGESDALDGAIRSRVMPQMNATSIRLVDMLQSRPRPLADATVAVVVGRGKAEAKRKPYLFLIQALGADRIEKVVDLKAAKEVIKEGGVDWLFVEDRDVNVARGEIEEGKGKGRKRGGAGCKVAGNELIVQSLILGKLYDGE